MACVLLLASVLSALAVAAIPASAAPAPSVPGPVPQSKGSGFLVSPPRLTVAADKINKIQRLEIENRGTVPLVLRTRLEAVSQRADGSSLLEPYAPYSAADWVTVVPDHFDVSPATRRYVQIRIRVPSQPEPGDHNVAIIFMAPPRAGKGNIHIAAGIGVPTLITVPGPMIDDVSVTRLKAPGFSAGGAIPITATLRETGDVHHDLLSAHDRLEATAGGATIMFPPAVVLRGSTITIATKWTHPPAFCVCHLRTAVVSDGHRSVATATVIIFPVVQVGAGIGALIVLVLAFLFYRRHQRRRLRAAYEAGRSDGGNGGPDDQAD